MGLLFAAIGATVTALVEATLAPFAVVGGVGPHPLLIGGVIWTIAAGIDRGITWAFVGGVVLDSLLARPLGATALACLVAVGAATLLAQPLARIRIIAVVVAVPVLSVVYSVVLLGVTAAMESGVAVDDPLQLVLPGAIYDGIVGVIIGPLTIALHDRRIASERPEW